MNIYDNSKDDDDDEYVKTEKVSTYKIYLI